MASLVNCKLVSPVTIEGLSAADLDIASQVLYIEPDNSLDIALVSSQYGGTGGYAHYTVAAADFTDYTHLLPADQREGIAAGSGAGGLGVTLEDTGTPYTPDNKVKITVDLRDSFSLFDDHTITIDIGGSAKEDNTRDAILALRTDFANQVRGGTITTFNSTTGESTDVTYTGVEGLVDVTFTAAAGITDPKSNSFAITSTPQPDLDNLNHANDYSQEDDIIYIKGDFVIGQWTKLGTINVSMNSTAVAAAITAKQIPDSSEPRPEGYYGFVFRKTGEAFNSFEDSSAISMDLGQTGWEATANSFYRLTPVGGNAMVNVAETPSDTNTGEGSIDAESTYFYWTDPNDAAINNTNNGYVNKQSASDKTYLATGWSRDLWFKYPTQGEMDEWNLTPEQRSFFHTTEDLNSAAFNLYNDITLSGFLLAAAPASEDVFQVTGIELLDATWEESNINNAGLPSIEDNGGIGDGQDDYAYIIPKAGSEDGSQTIRIKGTPGASFSLEIEKVEVNDFTTGRSVGEAVVGRNVLEWNESFTDQGSIDNGTTTVLTIPDSSQIDIPWPTTPPFSGGDIFNYYLTVNASSDTQIMQSAFDPRFGADIFHDEQAQSFSGGLNWTLGPGNDAKIRFRQIPSSSVTLSLATNGGFANSEITRLSGGGGGDVQLYAAGGGDQQIPFKFVIKGTPSSGQKFFIKDEFFDGDDVSITEADSHHDAWAQYGFTQCAPDEEFCSSHGINEFSSLDPGNFLITHDYPGSATTSFPDILNGNFHAIWHNRPETELYGSAETTSVFTNYISPYWTVNAPEGSTWLPKPASQGANEGYLKFHFFPNNTNYPNGQYSLTSNGIFLEAGKSYDLDIDLYSFVQGWTNYVDGAAANSITFKIQIISTLNGNSNNNPTTFPTLQSNFGWSGAYCTVYSSVSDFSGFNGPDKVVTITPTQNVMIQVKIVAENPVGGFDWAASGTTCSVKNVILKKQSQDYDDHSQQQEGEDVNILYLKTVKGNITNGAAGYEGDTSQFTVENLTTHDEHFSVVGVLKVNSFGDYTNNYVMDLSKILEWSIPVGG